MANPIDSYVQVAADGAGKKVRNQLVYVLDATGNPIPVYQQVVVLADESGNVVDSNLQPVLQELLETNKQLLDAVRWLGGDGSPTDKGPIEALWAQSGLPVEVGPSNPSRALSDKFGRQVIVPHGQRELVGTQTTTISASTTETTIITAGQGFNDVLLLVVSNTSAATSTRIDFRDTTLGTILFSLQSVGGAAPVGFALPVPIPQSNKTTNWTAQCATSTTDIRIYAVYVKNR